MARSLLLFVAVAAATTAREPSREVFVVVTPAEGGEGDRVVLPPGTTAFETAAAYCRAKNIRQMYSRDGQDPAQDSVCTIPLLNELRQESALKCASDSKPAIAFTVDVDRSGERTAEEFRICNGGTVEDAAVQFCTTNVSEEEVGACIDTLATEANRLIRSSASVSANDIQSNDVQMSAAPSALIGEGSGPVSQATSAGQSQQTAADAKSGANSAGVPVGAPAASPEEPATPGNRRSKKTPPRATFRKLAPGEKVGPTRWGILGFAALLLVWRWAENAFYARNADSKAGADSKKVSKGGGGSKKASKKKHQNKHKNKVVAAALGSSEATGEGEEAVATSAADTTSGINAFEPEQTPDDKTETEDESAEVATIEASSPDSAASLSSNEDKGVTAKSTFEAKSELTSDAYSDEQNSKPNDRHNANSSYSEQSGESNIDSNNELKCVAMVAPSPPTPLPSEIGSADMVLQSFNVKTEVSIEVLETSYSRNSEKILPKDEDEKEQETEEEDDEGEDGREEVLIAKDEAASAEIEVPVHEVESSDNVADTNEPSTESKEQTETDECAAHVADDESTTSAHDEHDTGELSDEGQAQATRVTIENESKVTGAVDKAEAARVIVNASNLDGDESDKEDSDATKEDSSVQEDVSQPSPSAIEDDTGRVQALEMEIADLIATLQATQARAEVDAAAARHWKACALAAESSRSHTSTTANNNNAVSSSKPVVAHASNDKLAPPPRNEKPAVAPKESETEKKSAPASKSVGAGGAAESQKAVALEVKAAKTTPLSSQSTSGNQPEDTAGNSASAADVATALAAGAAAAGATPTQAAAVADELLAVP